MAHNFQFDEGGDVPQPANQGQITVLFVVTQQQIGEELTVQAELKSDLTCANLHALGVQLAGGDSRGQGLQVRIEHNGEQIPNDNSKTIDQFQIVDGNSINILVETLGGL